MVSAPDEAADIQREMARIRVDLHQSMQGVVAGAEAATNWHRYVKHYPLAAMAVAFAIGYFVVPRRRRSATKTGRVAAEAVVDEVREVFAEGTPKVREKEKRKKGLIGMAFGFLGPIALRAAQGYAVQFVENWIVQQAAQNPLIGGAPGGPKMPGQPPNRPR